jgi:hypothetical protein
MSVSQLEYMAVIVVHVPSDLRKRAGAKKKQIRM